MVMSRSSALAQLYRLRHERNAQTADRTLELLRILAQGSLASAAGVARLHDALRFLRAYPQDAAVLAQVESMLADFAGRRDLQRHRRALADSGIAGTAIHYRFYWPTARWLHAHWPRALSIDWREWENRRDLEALWPLLLPASAVEALEILGLPARQWLGHLKSPQETDAAFLIRHFIGWQADEASREKFYDELDVPLILAPASAGPSRTHGHYRPQRLCFRQDRKPPRLPLQLRALPAPVALRCVGMREGQRLIDLARVQMVTRQRDLYAFMHADPGDVRVVDYPDGLQFVAYGLKPRQRCVLECMYVFLILNNGVPIGYTQAVTLLASAEINFNIFAEFRGMQTSRIFVAILGMARQLFAADSFIINTQQLGEGNPEALHSGAFWFYYKHGFRPRDPGVLKLLRAEAARKHRQPGYRSPLRVLRQLAGANLYLFLGPARGDLVTTIATEQLGLQGARILEREGAAAASDGSRECLQQALRLLDHRPPQGLHGGVRIAWERWSPILLAWPGIARWSAANKRALIAVVNAKGGRRESDFVSLFNRHRLLQKALLRLSRAPLRN